MGLELRQIGRLARRWWWLILLGPILGMTIAQLVAARQPAQYSATAIVTVGEADARVPTTNFTTIQGLQSMANTYQQLMQTWPVLEPVITQLQLPYSVGELSSRLSIQVVPNTLLMTITASDTDAERAAAIANTTVESLANYLTQQPVSTSASITASAPAQVPAEPYAPRVSLFLVFGAIGGTVLSLGTVTLIAFRDTAVRSSSDILELANSPLLATIPSDRRARRMEHGRTLFITAPSSPFAEGIRLLRSKVMTVRENGSRCLCVALTGIQRGDGTSTLTANLAAAIAQTGLSVIVVDANLRAPTLHHIFNVANERGLTTRLTFPEDSQDSMVVQTPVSGVWLMPTGPVWYGSVDLLNSARLPAIMNELKDLCDVVLLDTPPIQRFSDALAVIGQTDGAILVGTSGQTVQSALRRAADTLSQTGARIIGVVLNRDSGQIEVGPTPPTTLRKIGSPHQPPQLRSVRPARVRRETVGAQHATRTFAGSERSSINPAKNGSDPNRYTGS